MFFYSLLFSLQFPRPGPVKSDFPYFFLFSNFLSIFYFSLYKSSARAFPSNENKFLLLTKSFRYFRRPAVIVISTNLLGQCRHIASQFISACDIFQQASWFEAPCLTLTARPSLTNRHIPQNNWQKGKIWLSNNKSKEEEPLDATESLCKERGK
jgi:hypothetical protein